MSTLAESVDNSEAKELLNQEWNRVLNNDQNTYVEDGFVRQKIGEVLNASQLTYKYILTTNILAKAVNPRIHYRAMQAQWDHPGAYNARSLGHDVLVEWEKDHGERLGGSNEPFLNKPARYPNFSMENPHRSEKAHSRLYELLEQLQEKTESGEIEPVDILRQTLSEIEELISNR
ncbi:restriction endonuclease, SacI family [Halorussus caseinilyticus]|uniref:restriction endonuclease, SacI family n=1 Tax=Halorussus caseinilyticus TaxID=3034025 RepID=UPI0023E85638|nr:restriction endonuclease, SacI family [Halorussus sp. DT72]